MKRVAILGASGSIGTNTIEVLKNHKDLFNLVAFSVHNNIEVISSILDEFENVEVVGVKSLEEIKELIKKYPKVVFKEKDEGLMAVACSNCDVVVSALVGFVGLKPTIEAIKKGKEIALANKETLVAAGEIVMELARKNHVNIVPIDSEHSAIFQCLENNEIKNIILTASGGPFYKLNKEELKKVTLKDALNHPNWKMGKKITIDSATMFNKTFEIIEASHLFNLEADKIKVVIHPQSIVHSLVEFEDGAMKAQLGVADMKVAIAYALTYPHRINRVANSLELDQKKLEFYRPNEYQQEVLSLAYNALKEKGTYPTVLNATNEEAVYMFIEGKIKFYEIKEIVLKTLQNFKNINHKLTLADVYEADKWARNYVRRMFK